MGKHPLVEAALCGTAALGFWLASRVVRYRRRKQGTFLDPDFVPFDVRGDREWRWAFLSCGRVAHDFANALKTVDGAVLHVVATRDESQLARAHAFARAHGFDNAVGTYAEALKDPDVDVVYLSAMHSDRVTHVTQILNAGKHVLVEKPLACNFKDAEKLVALAKEKKLFLMEGMWTRFFPAVEKARELMESGVIGAVTGVMSDFAFDAGDVGNYPSDLTNTCSGDPIYHKAIGGGALLWAGPYPLAAGMLPFREAPLTIAAAGVTDPMTNVELSCAVTLTYDKPGGAYTAPRETGCPPRGATVSCYTAVDAASSETTTYIGTHGRIIIQSPGHCPTKLSVSLKGRGRNAKAAFDFEYAFPRMAWSARRIGKRLSIFQQQPFFYYPNSNGFCYEAAALQRCLEAGLTEAPQYTNEECLRTLKTIDEAKRLMAARLP